MNEHVIRMLKNGTADVEDKAALRTLLGAGAVAAATLSAVTSALLPVKEVITLTDFPVTVANTTGASFGAAKVMDFAEGGVIVLGSLASLSFNWAGQDIGATGSGDFSLGTTATADATLSTTDVNILPSSAMLDPFVAGVGTGTGAATAAAYANGTVTAADVYLNIIIDDADVSDAASDIVLVTGVITLLYLPVGDF